MNASFFEPIYIDNSPLSNCVESLFFWEGISERLGYRKFTLLKNRTLEALPAKPFSWVQTAIKILICSTLILPFFALVAKASFRMWLSSRIATVGLRTEKDLHATLDGVQVALQTLPLKVATDVRQGRVVFAPQVVQKQYQEVLNLIETQPEGSKQKYLDAYNGILNHEMLKLELARRCKPHHDTRLKMERLVLGEENYQQELALKAEQNLLVNLLADPDKHPEELALFKARIYRLLLNQRIQAQGVTVERAADLAELIIRLEEWQEELMGELEKVPPPEGFSEQVMSSFRQMFVEKKAKSFLNAKKGPEVLKKSVPRLVEGYKKEIETTFKSHLDFYRAWGHAIEKEFIQGINDLSDALGEGVCFALSLRWGANEQKNPELTADKIVETGEILPHDRFMQALYQAKNKKEFTSEKFSLHPLETLNLKGCFGIQEITCLGLVENLRNLEHKFELMSLKQSHGVLIFMLKSHQIYLRFDPEHNIYRIGDPNIGILKLKDQSEFFACLRDLLTTFYPEKERIPYRFFQLKLKEIIS